MTRAPTSAWTRRSRCRRTRCGRRSSRWLAAEAARAATDLGRLPIARRRLRRDAVPPALRAPRARGRSGWTPGDNPRAALRGPIEAIPAPDASFDVVLCAQVLEHVDDPAQGVRELARVTRPGGRVLLSTHGAIVYHPNPVDLWRWTHAGLERLFAENGDWAFGYGVRRLRHGFVPRDAERDLPRARPAAHAAAPAARAARLRRSTAARARSTGASALLRDRGRARSPPTTTSSPSGPRDAVSSSRAAPASSARTSSRRCSSAATTSACSTTSRPAAARTSRRSDGEVEVVEGDLRSLRARPHGRARRRGRLPPGRARLGAALGRRTR